MNEQLAGAIERITYYNEENGYSVVKILPEKRYPRAQARDGTVTVVGTMPPLNEGESAQFSGEWVTDRKYGLQFHAHQAFPVPPNTAKGIINYLSSGIVKGIGPRTAEKIVNHLGEDTVAILDAEPERVRRVPGLKASLADHLIDAWPKKRAERKDLIYLQGLGISARIAQRIVNEYGANTQQIISNNPYQLADDVFAIGFRKADQIARNMGLLSDDPHRLRAGLHYALNELAREGHTFAPRDELLEKAAELLGVDDPAALTVALRGQLMAGKLVEDELGIGGASTPVRLGQLLQGDQLTVNAIYLPRFFRAESASGQMLSNIARGKKPHQPRSPGYRLDALPRRSMSETHSESLSPQQLNAVRAALTSKVSVLTGGPGTGKTTALQTVINDATRWRLPLQSGVAHRAGGQTPGRSDKRRSQHHPPPARFLARRRRLRAR